MRKNMNLISIVFYIFFVSLNIEAKTIQVMSYNVENLFDADHDVINKVEKSDWAFLPKNALGKEKACRNEKSKYRRKECLRADWTNDKVELRLSQISDVVLKDHPLPEFLGLIEVENEKVVGRLAKKLGYESFEITDSPDARGIDVALLYKNSKDIVKVSRAEHVVPVDYATRNILEVEFLIAGKYPLTLFVNHWPSLANPDSWRVKAAEVLAKRSQEILKKNPNMSIVAMGDFNTIDDNDPHPFKTVLFKNDLFQDLKQQAKVAKPGTYYYPPKDQWNFLDHFFINRILKDGKDLEVLENSFEVYSPPFITQELKKKFYEEDQRNVKVVLVPKRLKTEASTKETIGFSDHFPILVNLEYPEVAPLKKVKKKK